MIVALSASPQTERINIFFMWLYNLGIELLWACLESREKNSGSLSLTRNPNICFKAVYLLISGSNIWILSSVGNSLTSTGGPIMIPELCSFSRVETVGELHMLELLGSLYAFDPRYSECSSEGL